MPLKKSTRVILCQVILYLAVMVGCDAGVIHSEDKKKELMNRASTDIQLYMDSATVFLHSLIDQKAEGKENLTYSEMDELRKHEQKMDHVVRENSIRIRDQTNITKSEMETWIGQLQTKELKITYDSLKKVYPENF